MHQRTIAPAFVVLCASSIANASVILAASESFDYPVASNPGNGGTGWASPWQINNGGNVVVSPGLSYPGIPGSGNAMGPTAEGSFIQRNLSAPITDAGNSSMLVMILIQSLVDGTANSQSTFGFQGGDSLVIGDLPETSPLAANWAMQASDEHYSNVPIVANATTLLVARVDFIHGDDRVRFWVNPTLDQSRPLGDALFNISATADVDILRSYSNFTQVFYQNKPQSPANLDEIMIFVQPIPAPASVLLFGLIAIARRRRRSVV